MIEVDTKWMFYVGVREANPSFFSSSTLSSFEPSEDPNVSSLIESMSFREKGAACH
jgi:hypothetical protein